MKLTLQKKKKLGPPKYFGLSRRQRRQMARYQLEKDGATQINKPRAGGPSLFASNWRTALVANLNTPKPRELQIKERARIQHRDNRSTRRATSNAN